MANIFNYGLVGVGGNVQYGKAGNRVSTQSGAIRLLDAAGVNRVNLEALGADLTGSLTVATTSTLNGNTTVGGTATFTVNSGLSTFGGLVKVTEGTAAAPALYFGNNTTTGLFGNTDSVAVAVNGAASVTFRDVASTENSVATFGGSTAITLPAGNDTARPTSPVAGMLRFTTQGGANNLEFYNGTGWEEVTSTNSFQNIALSGNFTGTQPLVADSPTDTLNLVAGVGISFVGNDTTDTLTYAFTRTGMTNKTTPVLGDTIALFDSASSDVPVYASFTQVFSALDVVNGITANGILVRTADDTYASRTIQVAGAGALAGLAITNGNGVSGDPSVGLDIQNLPNGGALTGTEKFAAFNGTANVAITATQIQDFAAGAVDPLVRQATINGSATSQNIGAVLPADAFVSRIVVNITTGSSVAVTGTIEDSSVVLAPDAEIDWQTPGIYVIQTGFTVDSGGDQVTAEFNVNPTGLAGTVTVEYKIIT